MLTQFKNADELLAEATSKELYKKLIAQLNKDFNYATIDVVFPGTIDPQQLMIELQEIIYRLVHEKFGGYLNLLYIVDVPEKQIKALDGSDVLKMSEDVAFLILKREWQKIWYKAAYKGQKNTD